jgi:hypothetical protein
MKELETQVADQDALRKQLAEKEKLLQDATANLIKKVETPSIAELISLPGACADAAASIQAIITAMESAGCTACAARLVAKRELKKYTGGTHGQAAIG